MRDNTPPPPMDGVEHQENLLGDDDDLYVIVSDADSDSDEPHTEQEEANDFEDLDVDDGSVITFTGHSKSVFCCNIDNHRGLVVSGGEDDKAFIWNMRDGTIILECDGHEDSVTHVEFNHDSSLVATGDMSGIIQVWDVQEKTRIWDFHTSDLQWLQWVPGKNLLVAGTVTEHTWLWDIPEWSTTTFHGPATPCTAGKVLDAERMVLGYEDGTIRIWDLNSAVVLHGVVGRSAHKGAVLTVDYDKGLIITGSVDGTSKLILAASGKVLNTFQCGNVTADSENPDSVESVAFLTGQQAFVACSVQGRITIWDIGSHIQKLNFEQQGGVIKMICLKDSPLFLTADVNGVLRLFDGRSGNLEASWRKHGVEILDFDITSDGQTVVTASQDGKCKVFSVAER